MISSRSRFSRIRRLYKTELESSIDKSYRFRARATRMLKPEMAMSAAFLSRRGPSPISTASTWRCFGRSTLKFIYSADQSRLATPPRSPKTTPTHRTRPTLPIDAGGFCSTPIAFSGHFAVDSSVTEPCYYAYSYPEPSGFDVAPVRPEGAYYHKDMHEWFLPYEVVRSSSDPDQAILDFLQTTYEAGANLAKWDRAAL